MILTDIAQTKVKISETILEMERPFKLSQLYHVLEEKGIKEKTLIIDVLNQLYESGLVDCSEVEDDTVEYQSNLIK